MFTSVFELININGSNGFIINGIQIGDQLGTSVSGAGDLNGDGLQDIILGASSADPNGLSSGQSVVILGRRSSFGSAINGSALDGTNGFRINGINALDFAGFAVSGAGDLNNDGFDDLVIGAYGADPRGSSSGQTYVVFGRARGFTADLELSSLNGSNGFQINGIDENDLSGFAVSRAGDINGDGTDDLLIGAYGADPQGNFVGQTYVVFGQSGGFGATFNLSSLDGSNGFQINGISSEDQAGFSVSAVGDINGDGLDDLIMGAPESDVNGFSSGQAYVVFGRSGGFPTTLNLASLNGSTGFRIDGLAQEHRLGLSVSGAGDLNGDGLGDIIVGAPGASPNGVGSGQSYVIFGQSGGFSATLNLAGLDGSNGFRINGNGAEDASGSVVGAAGDLNNDGYDDLLIGAKDADPNGPSSGQSYVVFGRPAGFPGTLELANLNGSNGFRINGIAALDRSGRSLSRIGDFNGDGVDDLLVGAPDADPDGNPSAGQGYVIFGIPGDIPGLVLTAPTLNAIAVNGSLVANLQTQQLVVQTNNNRTLQRTIPGGVINAIGSRLDDVLLGNRFGNGLRGSNGDDRISGLSGNDQLIGEAGNDSLEGGQGNDTISGSNGDDRLFGQIGNDFLVGGQGNDTLTGGEGNDTLVGGVGVDRIFTNGGRDQVVFDIGETFNLALMGVDEIIDFSRIQDKIVLDRTTFTALANRPLTFAAVSNVQQAGRSRAVITYVRSQGALFYNPDGNVQGFGSGGQFAVLQNRSALNAQNFLTRP